MKLYYLGPAGTFSETAARQLADAFDITDDRLAPCASLGGVIDEAIADGAAGVVPYHNLIDGLVQESLDRLLASGAVIYGALQLPIQIALGAAPGAASDAPIFSHAKALAQCTDYLDAQHGGRARHAVASTAHGADQALEQKGLALGNAALLHDRGLDVLCADATNRYFGRVNYTEFLLVGPPGLALRSAAPANRCVIACAPQTDRPGLLADILGLLSMFSFNLARLHSRPAIDAAPTQLDPQVFYLEIAGAPSDEALSVCGDALAMTLGGGTSHRVLFTLGKYALVALDEQPTV